MAVAVGAFYLLALGILLSPIMWWAERRAQRRDLMDRNTVNWPEV